MIIMRVKERVPLRIAEWQGGISMVLLGLYLVIWPGAFNRYGLSGFEAIAPVGVWVAACLVLGASRIGALVLNGHQPEVSAPIRCIVAGCGVALFSSIAAGYSLATNEHGPPMAMILAIAMLLGELFNTARSALDTYNALRSKREWTGFRA
jgi:hypothetical protein